MLIRFLHSVTLRIVEFTIGMALIGGSVLRDVTVALPMVIRGGAPRSRRLPT